MYVQQNHISHVPNGFERIAYSKIYIVNVNVVNLYYTPNKAYF